MSNPSRQPGAKGVIGTPRSVAFAADEETRKGLNMIVTQMVEILEKDLSEMGEIVFSEDEYKSMRSENERLISKIATYGDVTNFCGTCFV